MNFNLVILLIAGLGSLSHAAESLDEWLIIQVRKDEKLLSSAFSQTEGVSLELLKNAKTYAPFFLEPPAGHAVGSVSQRENFDEILTKWNGDFFLSGGYIYRLRFDQAPPLYATSAGDWDGTTWRMLRAGKDIEVEPSKVWNGNGNDYLYATILAGIPPKIIEYDQQGEMMRVEAFDVNASDFERRLVAVNQNYAKKGSPILEMLSLVEYLKDPEASWRDVDLSGQFNLRNQHLRDAERERLLSNLNLSRSAAIQALQSRLSQRDSLMPHASSKPSDERMEPKQAASSGGSQRSAFAQSPSKRWTVITIVIMAVLGVLWVLISGKRRHRG